MEGNNQNNGPEQDAGSATQETDRQKERPGKTKSPRVTSEAHDERISRFWERLFKQHQEAPEQKVPAAEFVKIAGLLGQNITWPACKASLRRMQERPINPGVRLRLDEHGAGLDYTLEAIVEQRERQYPDIKLALGSLVWKVIFSVKAGQEVELKGEPFSLINDNVRHKIDRINSKNPVVFIDAGSTTRAVVEQLMKIEEIPFRVSSPRENLGEGRNRSDPYTLVAPRFVTNSPPIAELISGSRQHRNNIKTTLIGGDYRPDHKAVCGAASQVFLERLDVLGDLAIIGTTGYRHEHLYGSRHSTSQSFCCDDLDESHLKSEFLRRTWLRVLVFDSHKLEYPELRSAFCPLSPSAMDIAVLDDGEALGFGNQVKKFCEEAKNAGVATAVLQTNPPPKR